MITHRQWLILFVAFVAIAALCLTAEGAVLGAGETSKLNQLLSVGWGNPAATFWLVFNCVTWEYAFFETGIGVWVKLPLMCLSAAVIIPLAFELFRLIAKPFGG